MYWVQLSFILMKNTLGDLFEIHEQRLFYAVKNQVIGEHNKLYSNILQDLRSL